MKILTALAISLVFVAPSIAAEEEDPSWHKFGVTDASEYSFRKGSFEQTENKAGETVVSFVVQVLDIQSTVLDYQKWYVSTQDCVAGIGKVVILSTDGTYLREADYVSKGQSIASSAGEILCYGYEQLMKQQEGKGI